MNNDQFYELNKTLKEVKEQLSSISSYMIAIAECLGAQDGCIIYNDKDKLDNLFEPLS